MAYLYVKTLVVDSIFKKSVFTGAQSGGCRFDKKPYYRYSGCHSYDVSALNIVLGLHFKFDADQYALWEDEIYFKRAAELASVDNTTDLVTY